ncbi:MAG: hypothetical protein ACR2PL_16365 [Dehalococcoidia bacterium]
MKGIRIVILFSALSLAGSTVPFGASPAATHAQVASQELFKALLVTPITDSELPSGFTSAILSKSKVDADDGAYGAIGKIDLGISGPDPLDGGGYVIFTDAAGAQADFMAAPALAGADPSLSISMPATYGIPTLLVTLINPFSQRTSAVCAMRVDTVIVVGLAGSDANPAGQISDTSPCILTVALVNHLQNVLDTLEGLPPPPPESRPLPSLAPVK